MMAARKDDPGARRPSPRPGTDLGTVLILDPETRFTQVDEVMRFLGFSREKMDATAAVPVEEPLVAGWSMGGMRPNVVYSCNPVARLRALDVSTAAPRLRAEIAARLSVLGREALLRRLGAAEDRSVILAIWALVEREDVAAITALQALAQASHGVVAEEAAHAVEKLRKVDAAREMIWGGLRLIVQEALEIVDRFGDPEAVRALLATPEDCALLFSQDIADDIAAHLAAHPHEIGGGTKGRVAEAEHMTACPAAFLRWDNPLSRAFPGGWRDAAGWLRQENVWLCWKTTTSPGHTILYDGLVLAGERWLLFPRGFRRVAAVVSARRGGAPTPLRH